MRIFPSFGGACVEGAAGGMVDGCFCCGRGGGACCCARAGTPANARREPNENKVDLLKRVMRLGRSTRPTVKPQALACRHRRVQQELFPAKRLSTNLLMTRR